MAAAVEGAVVGSAADGTGEAVPLGLGATGTQDVTNASKTAAVKI